MSLYVFSSATWENIEIGYANRLWAVSPAEPQVMAARRTRAKRVQIGDRGVLYVHKGDAAGFTVPFLFKSPPQLYGSAPPIWPEPWEMPFEIDPLGGWPDMPPRRCRSIRVAVSPICRRSSTARAQRCSRPSRSAKTIGP